MRMRFRTLLVIIPILLAVAAWAANQMQSVQVRNGQLREKPSFLGKIVSQVSYGDRLQVLTEKSGWTKVKSEQGREGWIHTSALTEKKIVLSSGSQDLAAGASGEEIALAGKGFNEEVEAEYRAANPAADYAWVDRMEGWRIKAEEAMAFLAAGDIKPEAGGE